MEELQKEKEDHKIRIAKIDKLKKAYAEYEMGDLDNDQFKYVILTEIGVGDPNGNLKRILSSKQMDKKSFGEILNNTDIIKHKKPEEKKNPDYTGKNNKYKRNRPAPVSLASPYEEKAHLKKATTKFIKNEITCDEFKEILKKEGINPEIEAINKLLRTKAEGNDVLFSQVMTTVANHKNDTFPEGKINPLGKDIRYKEDPGKENQDKLMMPMKTKNIL